MHPKFIRINNHPLSFSLQHPQAGSSFHLFSFLSNIRVLARAGLRQTLTMRRASPATALACSLTSSFRMDALITYFHFGSLHRCRCTPGCVTPGSSITSCNPPSNGLRPAINLSIERSFLFLSIHSRLTVVPGVFT
jgi:hypothetical protein